MIAPVPDTNDALSELAAAAGEVTPPEVPLDPMVDAALVVARGRRVRRAQRRVWVAVVATAMLTVGLGGVIYQTTTTPAAPTAEFHERLHLELPTGDRIVRTGHGELDIRSSSAEDRTLELLGGDALFDVVPLNEDERFIVRTPHLRAVVIGTVFAASVDEHTTRLEVFEGQVRVERRGHTAMLEAGETYDSLGTHLEHWHSVLAEEGRVAAASRRHIANENGGSAQPVDHSEPAEEAASRESRIEQTRIEQARIEQAGARSLEPSLPPASNEPAPSLAAARQWLIDGQIVRTRQAAHEGIRQHPRDGRWRTLLADVLRASGDFVEAAAEYDRAAKLLPPSDATHAGYLAAFVRFRNLSDPAGTIRSLRAARATESGSPIEERALVLAARAHLQAGDASSARAAAARYIVRFPAGADHEWMTRLAESP